MILTCLARRSKPLTSLSLTHQLRMNIHYLIFILTTTSFISKARSCRRTTSCIPAITHQCFMFCNLPSPYRVGFTSVEKVDISIERGLALKPKALISHTPFSLFWMNASIPGRYGFRRKSEQRSAALARAWTEVGMMRSSWDWGYHLDMGIHPKLKEVCV